MPENTSGAEDPRGLSAVGLTRLSQRLSFPPGEEALYRSILRLVDLGPEDEFVIAPCGRGVGALFLAETTGAAGAGSDPDDVMVSVANRRARGADLAGRLHFDTSPPDDLPYQDEVFDVALGTMELSTTGDPAAAVGELVRVTRPGGVIVLVQLVWTRKPDPGTAEDLVERLGARPRLVMEWKQLLLK
ncbi:MAG TPA: methyltransferase domain-containing protein [Longimicrobiales bacterium]|nr:methyltransferase domain-containing protein [Longimicrobiales bacterium]